jgi:hypothetical protein
MRKFTITQELAMPPARHWELFLDDAFQRALFIDGLGYPSYEILERADTDAQVKRTIRVMPKLDLPAPVAKLFGNGFGYVEAGAFDKRTERWRATTTPNMLKGKLRSEVEVRVEPVGDQRCRRFCDVLVECTVFAIGGMVESSFEKNIRVGWDGAAAFTNRSQVTPAPR